MRKSNPTILVVDDDPDDRMLITLAFKAVGVISGIQTASSGEEAIAYLAGKGNSRTAACTAIPTSSLRI
jgi:CheY-like chemotaxis protein